MLRSLMHLGQTLRDAAMLKAIACLVYIGVFLAPLQATPQADSIDSLQSILETTTVDSLRARTLVELSSQLRHSNTSEALIYAKEALVIIKRMHSPEREAIILQILGQIYAKRTDYKNAVFYTLQALTIYETINNAEGKANALNSLGNIYSDLRKYDLAKNYYLQSLKLFEKAGLGKRLSMVYGNLGTVLCAENKVQEGISYYQRSLEYSRQYKNDYSTGLNLINIGETYYEMGQMDSARHYYHRVLNMSKQQTGDYMERMAYAYSSLGKLELKEKNTTRAEKYLLLAKDMAEHGSIKGLQMSIYEELVQLYKQKKNYDAAFAYNKLYSAMKDSVFNETTVQQINEIQKAYEVEKRDKEIQLLNKDKEMAEDKIRTSRILYSVAFIFIIVVIIIAARNIVLKHKIKNKILSEEKAVVEKDNAKLLQENTEARYETLKSKINPHFLFNSLTTLSSLLTEEKWVALKYIEHFSDLYRQILETGDCELISLEQEIRIVQNYLYLQKMECGNNLLVEINIPENMHDYRLPPLALQMAVENAIKHNIITLKNRLSIFIHVSNEMVIIENNLQRKNSESVSTKIGQKNISARYRLISDQEPMFIETKTAYTVLLPLFGSDVTHKTTKQSLSI